MNTKERYMLLCEQEPSIPLFSQPWWLDSLIGEKKWDVALVEKNNKVIASMPYIIRHKYGFVFLEQAPLSLHLGPWFSEVKAKQATCYSYKKKLMNNLISLLPKFDSFHSNWHYSQTDWLPFYWSGFSQTTKYTYIIEPISDLNEVWKGFTSSYRNKVRKAESKLNVKSSITIESFYHIYKQTFQRQNIEVPHSLELLKTHDLALSKKDKRRIFSAHDKFGNIHSALYLVWDNSSAYVHMVGENPALRNSGAGILLIWKAIKYASKQLNVNRFDFVGSMIKNVEITRRDCGATQVPYFSISKTSSKLLKIMHCIRNYLKF